MALPAEYCRRWKFPRRRAVIGDGHGGGDKVGVDLEEHMVYNRRDVEDLMYRTIVDDKRV